MNKKELKNFINERGFFVHIDNVCQIERNQINYHKNAIKTSVANKIPEGDNIMLFKGRATQAFGTGEASRNMYKIDVNGWDWSHYVKNPQILLMHQDNEPIGKTIEIHPQADGVDILYYVDLKALEEREAHKVKTGLYAALSTGHITHGVEFEHEESGKRISIEEYRGLTWEESQKYINVVTKAEAVEVSVVSLPSNPDALTVQNGLEIFFNKILMPQSVKVNNQEEPENNEEVETTEVEEPEAEETTEKNPESPEGESESEETPSPEGENPEGEGENPEIEEEEEEEEEPEIDPENTVEISRDQYDKLVGMKKQVDAALKQVRVKGALPAKDANKSGDLDLNKAFPVMANALVSLCEQVEEIQVALNKIPALKNNSTVTLSQFGNDTQKTKTNGRKPGQAIMSMLNSVSNT